MMKFARLSSPGSRLPVLRACTTSETPASIRPPLERFSSSAAAAAAAAETLTMMDLLLLLLLLLLKKKLVVVMIFAAVTDGPAPAPDGTVTRRELRGGRRVRHIAGAPSVPRSVSVSVIFAARIARRR